MTRKLHNQSRHPAKDNAVFVEQVLTPKNHERLIVAALCAIAAVRVFIFVAAFPFFNNVDEQSHFDLVYKYSKGRLPAAALEKFDPNAAQIIVDSGTGEYFNFQKESFTKEQLAGSVKFLSEENNRETWSWPVYYILAGLWCRLGIIIGMADLRLLYWIRFLDCFIAAAFVWISWLFSRRVFVSDYRPRIALTLLVAFIPQDIFYAITSDVLSPLVFAASFLMLFEIYLGEKSRVYHFCAGLLVALTFLTKASNIAILPLAIIVILVKIKQAVSQKRIKQYLPALLVFILAAVLPVAYWLGRNYFLYGDIVGSLASERLRTWTRKPFGEFFNHPIFTPSGLFYFLTETTKRFWRGEFVWKLKEMSLSVMDLIYWLASAVFLAVSFLGLLLERKTMVKSYRFAISCGLLAVVLSFAFLAIMSMRYDFGQCFYPSRKMPYFISGRLIAGVILPFLFLYIDGLWRILSKLRFTNLLLVIIVCLAAAETISEVIISLPAFSSTFNWFHLK